MKQWWQNYARMATVALLVSPVAIPTMGLAQDFYFDGKLPILIRKPVVTVDLSKLLRDSETKGKDRANSGTANATHLSVGASTSGFVYHPALVTYRASIAQSLGSENFSDQTNSSDLENKRNFLGYSLDTTWLSRKNYNLNWSANRAQSITAASAMHPETTTTTKQSASRIVFNTQLWPTSIASSSSESESDSWFSEYRRDRAQTIISTRNGENSRSRLNFQQRKATRRILGRESQIETQNLRLVHTGEFREIANYSLNLDTVDQQLPQGTESSSSTANSRVSIRHPGNLTSNWDASFSNRSFGQDTNSTRSLNGSVRHVLYENLATTIRLGQRQGNSAFGNSEQNSQSLSMSYNRRTPWGSVSLGRSKVVDTLDDQQVSRYTTVLDEAYTFEGISTSIILLNANIDIESISVISADRLTAYEPGIDYTAEVVGDAVIINRDSLAGIGDDDTVLVSYRFATDPPSKRRNSGDQFSAGLSFGKLTLNYETRKNRSSLIEGLSPARLPILDSSAISAQYRTERSSTSLSIHKLSNEISSYQNMMLAHQANFSLPHRSSLSLRFQVSQVEFEGTGDKRREIGVNTSLKKQVGRTGHFYSNVFAKRATGDFSNRMFWGIDAQYSWRYGAWQPRIQVSYNDIDDLYTEFESTGYTVRLMLKRTFR